MHFIDALPEHAGAYGKAPRLGEVLRTF